MRSSKNEIEIESSEAIETAMHASRRSYELGRLSSALRRAAAMTIFVATLSMILFGKASLVWAPLTFVALTFTEWRGVYWMHAARRGLVAGLASLLLPLSLLRPCCGVDAKAMGVSACCVMPSACWLAGALVGLAMAILLPRAPHGHRMHAALGMILGVVSVAALRCSMLFLGEAIGLLGGIIVGTAISSAASVWFLRPAR